MRVGVLGSGMVARTLADRLLELGHEVCMGSRTADGPAARWAEDSGERARGGSFGDAAAFGELVINATAGARSLDAIGQAGEAALRDKVLLDVANPIDTSGTPGPVTLTVANSDSLAEQIQRGFPSVRVVKALNTMNCAVMARPGIVPGDHVVFLSGDDEDAKQAVGQLLQSFGWPADRIVDLGGLATARGTESFLLLWLPIWQSAGGSEFNIAIQQAR